MLGQTRAHSCIVNPAQVKIQMPKWPRIPNYIYNHVSQEEEYAPAAH